MMIILRLATLVVGFNLALLGTVIGQDDINKLRQEISDLKRELDTLRNEHDRLKANVDKLIADSTSGTKGESPKAEDGTLLGVLWEIDILKPDGSVFTTQKFYAAHGKVYFDSREVGTYVERGTRVRMDITKGVDDRAIGTGELERTSETPLVYQGRFNNKRGETPKIRLRVIVN